MPLSSLVQFASSARYGWDRIPGCERCHSQDSKTGQKTERSLQRRNGVIEIVALEKLSLGQSLPALLILETRSKNKLLAEGRKKR
jgi:hypothetical protein